MLPPSSFQHPKSIIIHAPLPERLPMMMFLLVKHIHFLFCLPNRVDNQQVTIKKITPVTVFHNAHYGKAQEKHNPDYGIL
jgi:hypothetical protein